MSAYDIEMNVLNNMRETLRQRIITLMDAQVGKFVIRSYYHPEKHGQVGAGVFRIVRVRGDYAGMPIFDASSLLDGHEVIIGRDEVIIDPTKAQQRKAWRNKLKITRKLLKEDDGTFPKIRWNYELEISAIEKIIADL